MENIVITDEEFEEVLKEINISTILEVSKYTPKVLRDIESTFKYLKLDNRDVAIKKELLNKLKKLTGIKNIVLTFKPGWYNVSVLPIFKDAFSKKILTDIKELNAQVFSKNLDPNKIKSLKTLEESSKHIEKIYIIFGTPILQEFSPAELTAIVLHEFGHIYSKSSTAGIAIPRLLKSLFNLSLPIVGFIKTLGALSTPIIPLPIVGLIMFSSLIGIHGITYTEKLNEHSADNYATKYGYGEEIIKVNYKFHELVKKEEMNRMSKLAWYKKLYIYIAKLFTYIFTPPEHPTEKKRIENVRKKMTEDYVKMYPTISRELKIIFSEFE